MVGDEHERGAGYGHGGNTRGQGEANGHRHGGHTHGHGHGHTHDHIDWADRIPDLRQADALHATTYAEITRRLTNGLPEHATVVDAGSGAGGMSAALAAALQRRGGGRLVLVDAVPELLSVAAAEAGGAAACAVEAGRAAAVAGGVGRQRFGAPAGGAGDAAVGAGAPVVGGLVADNAGDRSQQSADAAVGGPGEAALDAGARGASEAVDPVVRGGRWDAADPGSGAGGVADTVVGRPGELAVGERAAASARGGVVEIDTVKIDTVQADVASDDLRSLVPPAQLVWAAAMVHHLPDQQAGVARLAGVLAPGGVLAIAEGGLETECLPWDLGVGAPGFERRLLAAREAWFIEMRASIAGSVRMPYGWTEALRRAGLVEVGSFTSLVDHPAPTTGAVRDFVLARTARLVESMAERLSEEDREVASRILDPDDEQYLGHRGDLFLLGTRTVHYGRMP